MPIQQSRSQDSHNLQVDRTDRVCQEALRSLRDSKYRALAQVTCEFHEGVLILRGSVSSFYLKQIAHTVVWTVDGVIQIDNRLEVA